MAKKNEKKINPKKAIIALVGVYVVCHLLYGGGSILDLKMQQRQLAQDLETA